MFSQFLVTIGLIVEKWQQFFENQDGGGHHLELWLRRFFDVTDVFKIKVAVFLLNLVTIGQMVKKRQPFFEFKTAATALLNFYKYIFPTTLIMFQI